MMNKFMIVLIAFLLAIVNNNIVWAQSPAVVPASCTNEPDDLETRDIPYLANSDSGFKSANVFTLKIRSTMVNNRTDASIVLNEGADNCNYPSPTTPWVKSYDGCDEVWTADISWVTLSDECGLTRSEVGDEILFDGEIAVIQYEVLDVVRGTAVTRELNTGMLYRITFPSEIDLTSPAVAVFAAVDVQAAIVYQDYNQTRAIGEIDLFTSVQYPFMLDNGVVTGPSGTVIGTSIRNEIDNCLPNAPCEKTFQFDLVPNGVCQLDGVYNLTFDFICHPDYNATDCPLQGENGYIEFTIDSEDLCALFEENVDLSGTLRSYLSSAFAVERNAYILDQVSYWRAEVASTKVSIVDATINTVSTAFDGGADILLYDLSAAPAISATGTSVNFALDGDGGVATHERFHFDVKSSIFPVAADDNRPAVVKANIAVEYYNTAAKRMVTRYINDLPFIHSESERAVPLKIGETKSEQLIGVLGNGDVVASGSPSVNGEPKPSVSSEESKYEPTSSGGGEYIYISLIAVAGAILLCCGALFIMGALVWRRNSNNGNNAPDTQSQVVTASQSRSSSATHSAESV